MRTESPPSPRSLGRDLLSETERLPLGVPQAEAWLGDGLRANGLHEFYALSPDDGAGALSFALLLAWKRQQKNGRPLVWVREGDGSSGGCVPYGPGLVDLGIDPTALTLLSLPNAKKVLRAALDAARDGSISSLLIELGGKQPQLDLTASRRLALAAAETGTMVLLARSGCSPSPSAAHTRWQVAPSPSHALEADAPGLPAFNLTLLRQRGGRDGLNIIMEWDRDTASFRAQRHDADAAPLSRDIPTLDVRRTGLASQARAA